MDILMKAADYVESQDKVVNSAGITAICNNGPIKENGHSGAIVIVFFLIIH